MIERVPVTKASWQEDQRKIERDLLPRWARRKMKDIRRREIIDLLEDVADGKGDGRARESGRMYAAMMVSAAASVLSSRIERGSGYGLGLCP